MPQDRHRSLRSTGACGWSITAVTGAGRSFVATWDGERAKPRTAEQGAIAAIRLATLRADGPTAGFFSEDGVEPW